MSLVTKRKHVFRETMFDFIEPQDKQQIAMVTTANLGNSLFGVKTASDEEFLASLPKKFRNTIFLKTGMYVLIAPIEEGDKVKAEVIAVLMPAQIKHLAEVGKWPSVFELPPKCRPSAPDTKKNVSSISEMIPSDFLPASPVSSNESLASIEDGDHDFDFENDGGD